MRPSWDATWMAMADIVGQRSLCSRAKIGCIIVTADNRVEAACYNGPPPAYDHGGLECTHWCQREKTNERGPNYDTCPAAHGEANAIARSDWSRLRGATLYVNGSCCSTCAKMICATGISRVVHVVDAGMAYRNPETVEDFFRSMGVQIDRWQG